jgi:hypothetical protein
VPARGHGRHPAGFIFGLIVLDLLGRYFVKLSHWRIVRPFLELASYMRRLRQMPRLTFLVVGVSVVGHMFCAGAFFVLSQQLGIQIGYWAMFALAARSWSMPRCRSRSAAGAFARR